MFSLFLITQFFLLLIVNLIVSGKVLSTIFLSLTLFVTIGGIIILSYLFLAGFKAVVHTDFFQLLIMFIMTITTGAFLFHKTTITLSTLNFTNLGLGNIIGFIILAGLGAMVAPDLWQRLIASKDVKQLKRGLLFGVILVILGLAVSILGLATRQYFPNIKPEDALVIGFSNLLPGF